MPFMKPEIAHFTMLTIDGAHGSTNYVPADLVSPNPTLADLADYCEELPDSLDTLQRINGYWARFSAPGYLDCTDWCGPYNTEANAIAGLADQYDVCPHCWEQCWDTDEPCEDTQEN